MSYFKQDFVGILKKRRHVINGFDGPKVQNIYEGTIARNINDDIGHPNQVEISNYLYVTNGRERLISPKHWAQNVTFASTDDTTLDGTQCVTHHDCSTLIWGGGYFIHNLPLGKHKIFTR